MDIIFFCIGFISELVYPMYKATQLKRRLHKLVKRYNINE